MSKYKHILRIFQTVRHLKPSQVKHRLKFMAKRKLLYRFGLFSADFYARKISKDIWSVDPGALAIHELRPWLEMIYKYRSNKTYLHDLSKNRFTFLNYRKDFSDSVKWNSVEVSHLWRYNLHYFEYGVDLALARLQYQEESHYETFKNLCQSWIDENKSVGIGDAWHPYTISVRLVQWAYAYALMEERVREDTEFNISFINSYALQSTFLADNLERDVEGNHLIENAKALVVASFFLLGSNTSQLMHKGLKILWDELDEQILSDGGHYERSPMYHQVVLRDYLEVMWLLKKHNIPIPDRVHEKVVSMIQFQDRTLHPDRKIPLLNDAAFDIAPSPESLRMLAEMVGCNIKSEELRASNQVRARYDASESGYFVYETSSLFIIADAGMASPDFLPGHAHADFGTFEASFAGKRWIVDSGTYQYQGEMRNVYRSSKAHNCLVLNSRNQSDVWGYFRMAKRARPSYVETSEYDGGWMISSSHDGYKDLGVYPIRKLIVLDEHHVLLLDEIQSSPKLNKIESYLHLHPEVKIQQVDDHYVTSREGHVRYIYPLSNYPLEKEVLITPYSECFGMSEDKHTIRVELNNPDSKDRMIVGYVISTETVQVSIALKSLDSLIRLGERELLVPAERSSLYELL